jgi:hypothetical protein
VIVCWGFLELAEFLQTAEFLRRRFSQHCRRFTRVAARFLHSKLVSSTDVDRSPLQTNPFS